MMMTSSSFLAGDVPRPDDVTCALGTCVATMTQLRHLEMYDLSLPALKALPERTEPLDKLAVWSPGVNWVSGNVFCQCTHNTVLLVAVFACLHVSVCVFCICGFACICVCSCL